MLVVILGVGTNLECSLTPDNVGLILAVANISTTYWTNVNSQLFFGPILENYVNRKHRRAAAKQAACPYLPPPPSREKMGGGRRRQERGSETGRGMKGQEIKKEGGRVR